MNRTVKTTLLSFALIFSSSPLWASQVSQVKNNKVIIELEGSTAQVNDEFFLMNAEGKKKAIVKVTQVKGTKALAEITKGQAEVGMTLQAKAPSAASSADSSARGDDGSARPTPRVNKNGWGLLLGYHMETMSASFTGGIPVTKYDLSMEGKNFSIFGFYNYAFTKSLMIELSGGLFPLNVKTTLTSNACIGSTADCNVNINYLDGAILAKYYIPLNIRPRMWVGAGVDFLMPMSKSTTVLDSANIGFNQMFRFGGGADFYLSGKKNFIPVQFDYAFIPSSGISTSVISFRGGYGFYF